MLTVIVIAKDCLPGRVKTRLVPDLTPAQAASVAEASLRDTLDVVRALPADRRILAFDGDPRNAPAEAAGFEIVAQAGGGLDNRLATLFDDCTGPTLLVGMDTPQLTAAHFAPLLADWQQNIPTAPGTAPASGVTPADAWFGPSTDGGFWALAMTTPDGSLIRGVPMSESHTGRVQLQRLIDAGLTVNLLPQLTDVDYFDDAVAVAAIAPAGRFAQALQATGALASARELVQAS